MAHLFRPELATSDKLDLHMGVGCAQGVILWTKRAGNVARR
jgi:hypothetical protein